MGLIRSIATATSTALGDQWKEYFYCDALNANTLVVKGQKRVSRRSSNKHGEDNIISNGSLIAVNEGQCMLIVEQGKIVEVCAEAGEFTYDTSTEPSIFAGKLGKSIGDVFRTIGKRFTFGGDTAKDQRVYYFNIKEIVDNKFGTREPVPFRVVDHNIGLDVDISIRCNGVYSYRIANPLLFYTNVCGNVTESFDRSAIDNQLKAEFLTYLSPAFARISAQGIRYSMLPGHSVEIRDALAEVLTREWSEKRGLEIVSVAINSATASPEDEAMIKDLQRKAVLRDPSMGAATMVDAQAEAMKGAANNPNGAMMGFMGMNMAQAAGGMNAGNLYGMAAQAPAQKKEEAGWLCGCGKRNTGKFCAECGKPMPAPADEWVCTCGRRNTGKFCAECGAKRPAEEGGWVCACGKRNTGKFCDECGAKRPAGAPVYVCDKCGFKPADPTHPPKFCPNCGDPFNDEDIQ